MLGFGGEAQTVNALKDIGCGQKVRLCRVVADAQVLTGAAVRTGHFWNVFQTATGSEVVS